MSKERRQPDPSWGSADGGVRGGPILTPEQAAEQAARQAEDAVQQRRAEIDALKRLSTAQGELAALDDERLRTLEQAGITASEELERRSAGHPEWYSWDQMLEARQTLRNQGKKGTQQEVADSLRCSLDTVKEKSRKNGGWPRK